MKTTRAWLSRYLDALPDDASIAETLTRLGLEVDARQDWPWLLRDFTVAHIVSAKPHPDANKLQVCEVQTADGLKTIVCGAANARAGLYTVLAKVGVYVPGTGITIAERPVRGVPSQGMLCAAEELGLPWSTDGIVELTDTPAVGSPAAAALGLSGSSFDIAITPNRADCFAVRGIARDLAAAGCGVWQDTPAPAFAVTGTAWPVELNTDAVQGLAFARLTLPASAETPADIAAHLRSVGTTLRGAAVDITNFSCLSRGRPLHAFDAAKIDGTLRFGLSQGGESFTALNGTTYTLAKGALIISDDSSIISLAGIIGGISTAVTDTTTDVLLEAAVFDAGTIARTGQALGLVTDARQRFERGVDAGDMLSGLAIALEQLEQAGAKITARQITREPQLKTQRIMLSAASYTARSGKAFNAAGAAKHLTALGCTAQTTQDGLSVTAPGWRHDLTIPEDIIEELLRLEDYATIPAEALPPRAPVATTTFTDNLRTAFTALGCVEAISWSFAAPADVAALGGESTPHNTLKNPISAELSVLRPSILASLLPLVRDAVHRGETSGRLFEIAPVFAANGTQETEACAVLWGDAAPLHWSGKPTPVDAFTAKSLLYTAAQLCGKPLDGLTPVTTNLPPYLHPGQSGSLTEINGCFGVLHPATSAAFDIKAHVSVVFFNPAALNAYSPPLPALFQSSFQASSRDFAFLMPDSVPMATLLSALRAASPLVREVVLFDRYQGSGIPSGMLSATIRIHVQSAERTLTEKDIDEASVALTAAALTLGATLRS